MMFELERGIQPKTTAGYLMVQNAFNQSKEHVQ